MQDDSSTATPPENPNELTTEMTEAEEQAFVNRTLGIEDKDESSKDSAEEKDDNKTVNSDKPDSESSDATSDDKSEDEGTDEADSNQEVDESESSESENTEGDESDESESTTELEGPQTDDLWIEVDQLVTDKDGNQTTESVKLVYDPSNPAAFLPDNFQFKNDKQLFEILDAKAEIASLYKNRVEEFENKTQAEEAKTSKELSDKDVQAGWDSEIESLIDAGILEAPKAKPGDKNFLEDPAVQKLDEVFKYMATENTKRKEEGKPILRSFGTAFNLMTKEIEAKAETDKKKQDNKIAKERGSLVGGTSSSSSSEGPSYTRGSASNIWAVKVPD